MAVTVRMFAAVVWPSWIQQLFSSCSLLNTIESVMWDHHPYGSVGININSPGELDLHESCFKPQGPPNRQKIKQTWQKFLDEGTPGWAQTGKGSREMEAETGNLGGIQRACLSTQSCKAAGIEGKGQQKWLLQVYTQAQGGRETADKGHGKDKGIPWPFCPSFWHTHSSL